MMLLNMGAVIRDGSCMREITHGAFDTLQYG